MQCINKFLLHSLFLLTTLSIHTSEKINTDQELEIIGNENELVEIKKKIAYFETIQETDKSFNLSNQAICMKLIEATQKAEEVVKELYRSDQVKAKALELMKAQSLEEICELMSTGLSQKCKYVEGKPKFIQQAVITRKFLEYIDTKTSDKLTFEENKSRNELYEEFIDSINNLRKEHNKKIAQLQTQQNEFNQQKTFKLFSQNLIARENESRKDLEAKYLQDTNTLNQAKTADRTKVREHAKILCKKLQEEIAQQPSRRQSITDTEKKDFQKIVVAASKEMQKLHISKK